MRRIYYDRLAGEVQVSDLHLAAFCAANGHRITATSRESPQSRRVALHFRASDDLLQLIEDFRFGDPDVPARAFCQAISEVKSLVFEG